MPFYSEFYKVSVIMPVYSLEGIAPVVHPQAFVHETAVLIGDVLIGAGCYIGPHASLRGDFGRIIVEQGANVQDTCVMHSFPGKDCIVERDGHIGHGAVLHGCRIGRNAMVGMNAVVMDDVVIGESSIVGAMAFVSAKFQCPSRSLVVGVPAKVKRQLGDEEVEWKSRGTLEYQELAQRCLASLIKTEALTEVESGRGRMEVGKYDFKPRGA
jgi:phenylacetic acid degradation protein